MAVLSRLANFIAKQIATPANPPAGSNVLYPKSDDKWYSKSAAGVEVLIGPEAGSNTIPVQTGPPASPGTGQLWWDSDDPGVAPPAAKFPTGVITPVGNTAPAGSLLCDGSTFDSGTYPALAAYLGDTHGTHSGTTYYLPNLCGRVPVGYDQFDPPDSLPNFSLLGRKGGSKFLQQHSHTASTDAQGSHGHTTSGNARYATNTGTGGTGVRLTDIMNALGQTNAIFGWSAGTDAQGSHGHNVTVNNTGGGTEQNVQPFIVLNYVIWT